jgi:hypothetical protein
VYFTVDRGIPTSFQNVSYEARDTHNTSFMWLAMAIITIPAVTV